MTEIMRKKHVGCSVDRLLVGAPWVTLNDLRGYIAFPTARYNMAVFLQNKFALTRAGIVYNYVFRYMYNYVII